jgi:A/G-specific adenine glycosylase
MKKLIDWFLINKRDFPWRNEISPYRVWISEVMLQQTRAHTVIPYFERWMELFPDIATLSAAPLEKVIKAWEGLGYYSRARNLHLGAKQIIQQFGGNIPSTKEDLLKIRGLGPYTVAAILSFGFHKRSAPVDGNVLRVMSRYLWLDEDVGKSSTRKKIEFEMEKILDDRVPWMTAEALIELGATICLPTPRCSDCPLKSECKGALRGAPELLPVKERREKNEVLVRMVAIVEREGEILVRKNLPGKVMADLYEFPYFEGNLSPRQFHKVIEEFLGDKVRLRGKLSEVKHSFTWYNVVLFPSHFEVESKMNIEGWSWESIDSIPTLPFSAGHRKIANDRCKFWRTCGFLKGYEYSSS